MPRYGRGFSARSLWRMVQFAETFPQGEQVAKLATQLAWKGTAVRQKSVATPWRQSASRRRESQTAQ